MTSRGSILDDERWLALKGDLSGLKGTIRLDGADLAHSSVSVTLDVATIDNRDPQRDDHVRSTDFCAVERFPQMTLESRSSRART